MLTSFSHHGQCSCVLQSLFLSTLPKVPSGPKSVPTRAPPQALLQTHLLSDSKGVGIAGLNKPPPANALGKERGSCTGAGWPLPGPWLCLSCPPSLEFGSVTSCGAQDLQNSGTITMAEFLSGGKEKINVSWSRLSLLE